MGSPPSPVVHGPQDLTVPPRRQVVYRAARTAAVAALLMVVVLVAAAAPAWAHGRSSDSTNYDSRIEQTPGLPGVSWRMYGGDEYLALTNAGPREVVVLGYDGEPWLRVGSEGVFRNRLSSATYVNADRYANVAIPDFVDPDAQPDWEQVSEGSSWYWHDHRTHWMSPTLPPVVRAAPDTAQVVQEWDIPLLVAGEQEALSGALWWVPGPSPVPWLAIGIAVSLPALVGLLRGRGAGPAALVRPAAAVLAVVAVVNLVHLADDLFAAPAPLPAKLLAAAQTALFIAVTAFGAARGWQARAGAFTALGVGAVAAFVGQGLLYLPALTSSQLASLVPDAVTRTAIALSLVQLLPVGAVAVVGVQRHQALDAQPADGGGGARTTDAPEGASVGELPRAAG